MAVSNVKMSNWFIILQSVFSYFNQAPGHGFHHVLDGVRLIPDAPDQLIALLISEYRMAGPINKMRRTRIWCGVKTVQSSPTANVLYRLVVAIFLSHFTNFKTQKINSKYCNCGPRQHTD